jgi:hypothetical protein
MNIIEAYNSGVVDKLDIEIAVFELSYCGT